MTPAEFALMRLHLAHAQLGLNLNDGEHSYWQSCVSFWTARIAKAERELATQTGEKNES